MDKLIKNQNIKKVIILDGLQYLYSISQSENNELIINFSEMKFNSNTNNVFYSYKKSLLQIKNEMKLSSIYQDINDIINLFQKVFDKNNVKKIYLNDKYILIELNFGDNLIPPYLIELTKNEQKDLISELIEEIKTLKKEYNELRNEFNELKMNKEKENNKKEIIKEIIDNRDIKMKLFDYLKNLKK